MLTGIRASAAPRQLCTRPGWLHARPRPLSRAAAERIAQWRRKLLKRGRRLDRLGEKKRHRLRLRAKRFRYALEWSSPFLTDARAVRREKIRQARAIQDALGPLNDCFTHQAQARNLKIDPLPSMVRLGREKVQARRLKAAARAFGKLARLH